MATTNNVIDINIKGIEKQKFRINSDDSKIIELNISDFNIIQRIEKAYPKLEELEKQFLDFKDVPDTDDEEMLKSMSNKLSTIDNGMREQINYIFDSDVCSVCADNGSMYDLINGEFRYEVIITALSKLYEDNIAKESKKVQARIKKHTAKYSRK